LPVAVSAVLVGFVSPGLFWKLKHFARLEPPVKEAEKESIRNCSHGARVDAEKIEALEVVC
jgi:hypothetical protein